MFVNVIFIYPALLMKNVIKYCFELCTVECRFVEWATNENFSKHLKHWQA